MEVSCGGGMTGWGTHAAVEWRDGWYRAAGKWRDGGLVRQGKDVMGVSHAVGEWRDGGLVRQGKDVMGGITWRFTTGAGLGSIKWENGRGAV